MLIGINTSLTYVQLKNQSLTSHVWSFELGGAKIAEEFFMLTAIDCINISIGPDVKRGDWLSSSTAACYTPYLPLANYANFASKNRAAGILAL